MDLTITYHELSEIMPNEGDYICFFDDDPTEIFFGEVEYSYIENDVEEMAYYTNGFSGIFIDRNQDPKEGCSRLFSVSVNGKCLDSHYFWAMVDDLHKAFNDAIGEKRK